jgi:ATP adenylyltransferase
MADKQPEHVEIANAHTPEYRRTLEQIAEQQSCPAPFCIDEAEYHIHPVEHRGSWKITRNTFNYQDALHAFLLVPKRHVAYPWELSMEEREELNTLVEELVRTYELKGLTQFMRFGEKSHTGASITHLHVHLVAGHPKTVDSEPIFAVIGFKPKKDEISKE